MENTKLITAHLAILGQFTLIPGIQKTKIRDLAEEILIQHEVAEKKIYPKQKIEADTSDCTIFTVIHPNNGNPNYSNAEFINKILDNSLEAITTLIIWNKCKDVVDKVTSYSRQVGRLDVKFFFINGNQGCKVAWKNPAYWLDIRGAAFFSSFLGNMVVQNGPAASPIDSVVQRIMSSIDLINLGFYTEAFITAFSLLDDLIQETLYAGLNRKGVKKEGQKDILRAIERERLKYHLTDLLKLVDWKSMEEDNEELLKKLIKKNTLRNNIMHGSIRIDRKTSLESVDIILHAINWLRGNPFGYKIPNFPLLIPVQPEYIVYDD